MVKKTGSGHLVDVGDRVLDDGGVIGRKVKVPYGKVMNDRVYLEDRSVDAVGDQSCRRSADTEATGLVSI